MSKELLKKFPFLSIIKYVEEEYIGIIQNQDKELTSVYLLNYIKEQKDTVLFLHYGELWWWGSNRKVPINIFLKEDMKKFRYCLKSFATKEVQILEGAPAISINNIIQKRVKRKQIELVRKLK